MCVCVWVCLCVCLCLCVLDRQNDCDSVCVCVCVCVGQTEWLCVYCARARVCVCVHVAHISLVKDIFNSKLTFSWRRKFACWKCCTRSDITASYGTLRMATVIAFHCDHGQLAAVLATLQPKGLSVTWWVQRICRRMKRVVELKHAR